VRGVGNERWFARAASAVWEFLIAWRGRAGSLIERAVPMIAGVIVLGSNVFPWYVVWLIPFLVVTPSVPWIAFTGTVAFAYTFFLSEPWTIPLWAQLVEVAPLAIAGAVKLRGVAASLPSLRARARAR